MPEPSPPPDNSPGSDSSAAPTLAQPAGPLDPPPPPPGFARRLLRAIGRFFYAIYRFFVFCFKVGFVLGTSLGLSGGFIGWVVYQHYNRELPRDLFAVADYRPNSLTQVFADDGTVIGEFYLERRVVVPLDAISPVAVEAFVAAEDARFFQHRGIDPSGILRAMVTNLKAGRVVQGGSTITQQVVKNLLLTSERSLERKIKEAILSFRIENELDKEQILGEYLNMVYLGHGAYGVEAASQTYFGHPASSLSVAEGALLAGLVQGPNSRSPYLHLDRALERQHYVLRQMVKAGFLTWPEEKAAREQVLSIVSRPDISSQVAPDYVEHIRRLAMQQFGGQMVYKKGLRIETPLRLDWEAHARKAVQQGLLELTARQGYHGPEGHLTPDRWQKYREDYWKELNQGRQLTGRPALQAPVAGEVYAGVVISNTRQAIRIGVGPLEADLLASDRKLKAPRLKGDSVVYLQVGDVLEPGSLVHVRVLEPKSGGQTQVTLADVPAVQGALLAMEPHTGYVRAMVGSYDFQQSRFNRATQARRQAGSSFKPFVYATALEAGLTQLSPVVDAPISFTVAGGRVWTPRNYGNKYYGNVTLRTALTRSLNTVSVKLVNQYGVSNVIQLARRLGIKSDIPSNLSLALGSASVTPLEMTSAFASLASNGEPIAPRFIKRVTDDEGKVIFEANPPEAPDPEDNDAYGLLPAKSARPALTPATAYVLSDMMRSVVESGTAQRVKALGRPAAGKTGTTNNYIDAWFIGYTPELVTGVWVGVDNRNTLGDGETGGKSAAPIWLGFMEKALHDAPIKPFEAPPGIVFLKADPLTGNRAAGPGVPYLPFRLETLPAGLMGQRSSGIDPADTW